MNSIWASRKFKALVLTIIVEAIIPWAAAAGWLSQDSVHFLMIIVGAVATAYLGAQGLADMGKEKSKIKPPTIGTSA